MCTAHSRIQSILFLHIQTPQTYRTHRDCTKGKKIIFVLWESSILSLSVLLTGLNHQYDGLMYRGRYGLDALRSTSQMGLEAEGGP